MKSLRDRLREVSPTDIGRIHRALGQTHRTIGRVMFPVLFAVGIWMAWRDLQPVLFWRATDAIVMQSDVERARTSDMRVRWRPRVQYRWESAGRWHTGDRYSRTEYLFNRRSDAWKIAHRYTGEQHVRAWVDPAQPTQAVLDRTPGFFPYLFLLVAALLMSFAGFMSDPNERRWRAAGPGWALDVHMRGVPTDASAATTDPQARDGHEFGSIRDGTTGEVVRAPATDHRPLD